LNFTSSGAKLKFKIRRSGAWKEDLEKIMSELPPVARRFLRYVRYDTQSSESSQSYPSTEKQKDLLRVLAGELRELGLDDAAMDEHGYVIATLPSNTTVSLPVVGLIAHVDTSPEVSGAGVNPQIHEDYDGGPIKLNATLTLTLEDGPLLGNHVGGTIITTDGNTLLGADDKAGVAEIMTLLEVLRAEPGVRHGTLRIAFTPDEEVGRGTEFFDVKKFGAGLAYTVDTGNPGNLENETFCAYSATVTCKGVNVHPGYAKGKLASAIKAAARFVDLLPPDKAPETTEGRQGYLHPHSIRGGVEEVVLELILRDFEEAGIRAQQKILEDIAGKVKRDFPKVGVNVSTRESYRNMRFVLEKHPGVIEYALEAIRRSGLEPKLTAIRGGTDGTWLSYKGLPTPNLFAGGDLFHSRQEWIAVEDMQKTVETLKNLVQVVAERGQL
jgi:tripeptide aminopeptidase